MSRFVTFKSAVRSSKALKTACEKVGATVNGSLDNSINATITKASARITVKGTEGSDFSFTWGDDYGRGAKALVDDISREAVLAQTHDVMVEQGFSLEESRTEAGQVVQQYVRYA